MNWSVRFSQATHGASNDFIWSIKSIDKRRRGLQTGSFLASQESGSLYSLILSKLPINWHFRRKRKRPAEEENRSMDSLMAKSSFPSFWIGSNFSFNMSPGIISIAPTQHMHGIYIQIFRIRAEFTSFRLLSQKKKI